MSSLAHYLSVFLREKLPCERRASQHTCESYAYTFQLLVCFAAHHLKTQPSKLKLECLDVKLIIAFLNQCQAMKIQRILGSETFIEMVLKQHISLKQDNEEVRKDLHVISSKQAPTMQDVMRVVADFYQVSLRSCTLKHIVGFQAISKQWQIKDIIH